ncbi:MAG: IclR family transcriptional regulator C-terminal domain-containing protein [Beijerinckiaceae bacterium]|jgi:DNA-binding IclR family transcriptional regulator|nr:IclR family transcriptional regulator C-terminal domain-containing protein [Beijerinckiaceae bacterium]
MQTDDEPASRESSDSSGPQSSLDRLLRVIDVFTPEKPEWTADQIGQVMGVSRATQYRYIKSLTNAGLLGAAGDGFYRLGPRFVVIDRQIRLSDPLLRYGPPAMARACAELRSAQLLCTYFGDEVLCIHQEVFDTSIHSSMDRGRPFPLFRGSPSRAILAWLPENRLRNLMLSHSHEIRESGLGATWAEFRQRIRDIRAQGYYVGRGEIDQDLMGVAVPVLRPTGELMGSLTTIMPLTELTAAALEKKVRITRRAASEIISQVILHEAEAKRTAASL